MTSEVATLTVETVASITAQPIDVTAAAGETVYFSVTAKGDGITYKWQYKKTEGSWSNTSMEGAATPKITVPVIKSRNGYQYRCIVTDKYGNSVTSNAATLTVGTVASITDQPEDVNASAGETVYFSVTAIGDGITYKWQYKKPEGSWSNTSMEGASTAKITVPVVKSRNGYQYRCIVTDKYGNKVTSESGTLTVK